MTLPQLPEPAAEVVIDLCADHQGPVEACQYLPADAMLYTADQMRAYAEQVRAEERERWESAFRPLMPADFKDWHQNSPEERPMVAAAVLNAAKESEAFAWESIPKAAENMRERCIEVAKGFGYAEESMLLNCLMDVK